MIIMDIVIILGTISIVNLEILVISVISNHKRLPIYDDYEN